MLRVTVKFSNLKINLYNVISHPIFCYFVEQMYTFTVHTINDAVDNTSEPSQPLTCTTKDGGIFNSSVQ